MGQSAIGFVCLIQIWLSSIATSAQAPKPRFPAQIHPHKRVRPAQYEYSEQSAGVTGKCVEGGWNCRDLRGFGCGPWQTCGKQSAVGEHRFQDCRAFPPGHLRKRLAAITPRSTAHSGL